MGSACSTPYLDSLDPPLEILILSDGCADDQAISQFLSFHPWLAQSSILSKRLPPRKPAPSQSNNQPNKRMLVSTSSSAARFNPTYNQRSAFIPSSSVARSRSANQSISPTNNTQFSDPPMIHFICDGKPVSLRFHVCIDYQTICKRRASALQRQAKPHTSNQAIKQSINQSIKQSNTLWTNGHLDGCLLFLSPQDRLIASSMLIGGLRPLLKRKPSFTYAPYQINCGLHQPITHVMPFALIGLNDPSPKQSVSHSNNQPNHQPNILMRNQSINSIINAANNQIPNPFNASRHQRSNSDTILHHSSTLLFNRSSPQSTNVVTPLNVEELSPSHRQTADNQHRPPLVEANDQSRSQSPSQSTSQSNFPTSQPISHILNHNNQSIRPSIHPVSSQPVKSLPPSQSSQPIHQIVSQPAKPLTMADGQSLANDTGACGFYMVDWLTGKTLDEAVRSLVRAINAEKNGVKAK